MAISASTAGWVALAALVFALLAVLLAAIALGTLRASGTRQQAARRRRAAAADLPVDVQGLREEVARLREEVDESLRHLAVVRYDAFGDMGGHLSWSLALLDEGGNGVVLTSIHGRSDSRSYAKNITGWTCDQPLSPEEQEAVELAHARAEV